MMRHRFFLTGWAVTATLAGCVASPALVPAPTPAPAWAPPPAPAPYAITGYRPSLRAPAYPDAYADSGRAGQVTVRCTVMSDRSVTDCTLLKVVGGDAFGEAVLAWLVLPGARWPGRDVQPGVHTKTIRFTAPSKPRG